MIVLDENFIASQCEELRRHGLHFRRIGGEIGYRGMGDLDGIVPALHHLRQPTFFSCDAGFYHRSICHAGYCLVFLDVAPLELASYVRRFLHHPEFCTAAMRMGCVVRISPSGITYRQRKEPQEHTVPWP